MNDFNETLSLIETFFRIHFSKNDEILEDLIPKLHKVSPNSAIPNSLKMILEDSGPSIVILNKIVSNPYLHYKPTSQNIQNRASELEEIFNILRDAKNNFSTELEFLSLVNAIVAFHKKETDYPQVFNFFLTLVKDPKIVKDLLKLLNDKALHSYMPYVAGDESDGEFSFDEISEHDPDLQPRIRMQETIPEILAKCNEKSDIAMSMFLDGVINRDDLLLIAPNLEHSKLTPDPVAIDSHNYVTQSLKKGEQKKMYDAFPRVQHSYRNGKNQIPVSSFTGASVSEQFTLNRDLLAVFTPLKDTDKYPPAINVDSDVSITSIYSACQILHDQEIDSDVLYKATTDILSQKIHPGLTIPLSNIYGYQSDDIIDFLTSSYEESKPIVVKTMTDTLTKYAINYYKTMNDCYSRLTKESFRIFPHPEYIENCFTLLKNCIQAHHPDKLFAYDYIVSLFKNRNSNNTFEMSFWQTNLVTKFCLLYKFYIRKHRGYAFQKPLVPLVDSSTNWFLTFEGIIQDALKDLEIDQFDNPEFQFPTDYITKAILEVVKNICDEFKESNLTPEGSIKPELLSNNIKHVKFKENILFDVPVLELIILPDKKVDLGLE